MPTVRLAALCAAVLTLAGCGAEPRARAAQTPAPTPLPSGLQFVVPPIVTFRDDGTSVAIAVRLNRPLRHDLGHPAQYKGQDAYLDVPGAGEHDFLVGMQRDTVFPTCYSESVSLADATPPVVDGQAIEVSLVLSETERVTGATTVRKLADGVEPRPALALGCPHRAPGQPAVRRCHGEAPGGYSISVMSARGTTCRRGLQIMRRVAPEATTAGDCYEDLCLRGNVHLHYRCTAALAGEAFWDIACRRGKAEIRGYTAD